MSTTIAFLDPMSRDYRGKEAENISNIVVGDKKDIDNSDVVLVNACKPSWGTAMEIMYAFINGKRIIAFGAGDKPSPWLVYHCTIVNTLVDACNHMMLGTKAGFPT
jgi:nucleoside 2-deoxyribosyltransferase